MGDFISNAGSYKENWDTLGHYDKALIYDQSHSQEGLSWRSIPNMAGPD